MISRRPRLACAALLLALAAPVAAQEERVTAAGLTWAVAHADWFAIEGAWAVDVGLAMRESFSFSPVPFERICNDLLADLPGAPPGMTAADLFRLSLNLLTRDGPAFEMGVPMAVEDGRCRAVARGDSSVAPLPPPLETWSMENLSVDGEGGSGVAIFGALPGVEDPGPFPLDAACRAVLADRFKPLRDLMLQARPRLLEVKGRTQGTAGSIDEVFIGSTFDVSDGTCRFADTDR